MSRAPLSALPARVDLAIVGGGITGAGIFREATRTGASVLLVEQGDFASGTSSGSSKLVHGGLRYMKSGQWGLTLESVRERQRLLREAPGLVETQAFMMPIYRGVKPGRFAIRTGLWIYDRMAGGGQASRWAGAEEVATLEPHLRREGMVGAMLYDDAQTDDAGLVLRLIFEGALPNAIARNYTRVTGLLRRQDRVCGVALHDAVDGTTREVEAAVVVNATGAWAETLSGSQAPKLRPLRGSHFVFPLSKLPVRRAVSWLHPRDHRPIFAYPWQGAALYGTTDLDHDDLRDPPRMSAQEAEYLLEGLAHEFPALKLRAGDATSVYSAVRPVVAGGKADPSAESRESAMWSAPGVVGITGGKLTTFRVTARQVLGEAAKQEPRLAPKEGALFEKPWAASRDLRARARNELVVHLDDLLLRRTRLGLVEAGGARARLPQIRSECQSELGWSDEVWQQEERRYLELWDHRHSPGTVA